MLQEIKVMCRNVFSKTQGNSKKHTWHFEIAIALLLLIIHICFIKLYRPYIYANYEIKEGLTFVNNYPSFSAVLLGYLVFKIYHSRNPKVSETLGPRWEYYLLSTVVFANYFLEGLDIILGKGDWYNMIAVTLGGIFVFLFVYFKNNR